MTSPLDGLAERTSTLIPVSLLTGFVGSRFLRIKGILNIATNAPPLVVHDVQHILHPPLPLPARPSENRHSRLVFITHDVRKDAIEETFNALAAGVPACVH
jgi:hypothetical protein